MLALDATAVFNRASGQVPSPGVSVAADAETDGSDPRRGRLAGGFARAGLERFVAHDMNRPPPNAERRIIRGR